MEEEASLGEASWGTRGLAGSPGGLELCIRTLRGDSILEVLCLEPFCSPTCFRL